MQLDMKPYTKKNKLSNNIRKKIRGKYVIHKHTNAILKVINVDLEDREYPCSLMLVRNPYNALLVGQEDISFPFSIVKETEVWISINNEFRIIPSNGDFYWNVVAEDLYLINY